MSIADPISDMLTRIRNAQQANKSNVTIPSSKLKVSIAKVLKDEGYIDAYVVSCSGNKKLLLISLRYYEGKPVISQIDRVSRPSLRVYRSSSNMSKVIAGLGIAIVSTSRGVMSDHNARHLGQGGEILCSVS